MPDQTPAVGMDRKLAALFSADVVGESCLMGPDEEVTIRTLTASCAVLASLIQRYHERVVDAPGDKLLAEFARVVEAVCCAVEIQHALKETDAALPDHRQLPCRIGTTLGDGIAEGKRLYGDGVIAKQREHAYSGKPFQAEYDHEGTSVRRVQRRAV